MANFQDLTKQRSEAGVQSMILLLLQVSKKKCDRYMLEIKKEMNGYDVE